MVCNETMTIHLLRSTDLSWLCHGLEINDTTMKWYIIKSHCKYGEMIIFSSKWEKGNVISTWKVRVGVGQTCRYIHICMVSHCRCMCGPICTVAASSGAGKQMNVIPMVAQCVHCLYCLENFSSDPIRSSRRLVPHLFPVVISHGLYN